MPKKILLGVALAYIGLVVILPFVNVFIQVGRWCNQSGAVMPLSMLKLSAELLRSCLCLRSKPAHPFPVPAQQ